MLAFIADQLHLHFLEDLADDAILEDLETEEAEVDGASDPEGDEISGW